MKTSQDFDANINTKKMNMGQRYTTNLINHNNNTQNFFPAGDVCNHVYNRTYFKDNNFNINHIGNNCYNTGQVLKNLQETSQNVNESQENPLKNKIEEIISHLPSNDKIKTNKPTKRNTNCPHLDARHYAKVRFILFLSC